MGPAWHEGLLGRFNAGFLSAGGILGWDTVGRRETGISTLEYVLLVALVAMIALGSLVYLGSGSGSPAHVANNVGNNVSGDAAASGAGAPIAGTSTGTPVKAWCASGGKV